MTVLRDGHRRLARAQYAEIETLTGWFRRGAAAEYARSGRLLHAPDEGAWAAMEAAAVLRMTEHAVNRAIELGLALDGLPCTRAGFAAGELDEARARVIAEVTSCVTPDVRAELDRRLAERGTTCDPRTLRATGRRWAIKLDPDSAGERRRRAVEDRDVRVRAVEDGMAQLEGWLPVEAAQALAGRLMSMAIRDVCGEDPRTIPQRRADALIALVDGTGRLVCGCAGDCPAAAPASETSVRVSVQVGVSLETLLGLRDWPGYLHGAGAIDPDLARTLARDGRWEWIIAAIDAAADSVATSTDDSVTTGTRAAAAAASAGSAEGTTDSVTTPACDSDTTPAGDSDTTPAGDSVTGNGRVVGSGSVIRNGNVAEDNSAVDGAAAEGGTAAEPSTAAGPRPAPPEPAPAPHPRPQPRPAP